MKINIVDAIQEIKYMIDEEPEESFKDGNELDMAINAYNDLCTIQENLIKYSSGLELNEDLN